VKRHYREDYNQNPHNYTSYEQRVIRVLRHAESNGGLNHRQDWVQDETLLVVFGDVVWVFHCKSKRGVSTNVLSKSNHTHGGGVIQELMQRAIQGYG
jgi:hypothetical protein